MIVREEAYEAFDDRTLSPGRQDDNAACLSSEGAHEGRAESFRCLHFAPPF